MVSDSALRALIDAAKTVAWRHDGRGYVVEDLSAEEAPGVIARCKGSLAEAAFIAAMHPHAAEALLDRAQAAEAKLAIAVKALEACAAPKAPRVLLASVVRHRRDLAREALAALEGEETG